MAAVPSAVTRRREQEEAALRAQGVDPNAPPEGVVDDQPAQPSAPAPNGNGNVNGSSETEQQLRARIAELENAERTSSGRSSTAQRELDEAKRNLQTVQENRQFLETTVQELQTRNEEMQRQLDELTRQSTLSSTDRTLTELATPAELTPRELETFDAETRQFIDKVARNQLATALKPMLERMKAVEGLLGKLKDLDKLPVLEQRLQQTTTEAQRRAGDEFFRKEILHYFPDFETVRESDKWKAYLNQEIPNRGMKVGHQLTQYHNLSNAVGIRSLIGAFYDAEKNTPSRDSLATPGKTQAEGHAPREKPRFKASEYQTKLRQFINKKLSKADWDAYKADFDAALLDGRVDRDAPI